MAAAARSAQDDDAKLLRHRADLYASFGRAYNSGTAPGVRPVDAFSKLQEAGNYDNALGRAFDAEINTKLGQIAPRAAIKFLANKDYKSARLAALKAESLGAANETTKLVRDQLDSVAGKMFNEASKQEPDAAKETCRKILEIVEPSSNYGQKAKKLLAQLGK